jgi:hypothetical protein
LADRRRPLVEIDWALVSARRLWPLETRLRSIRTLVHSICKMFKKATGLTFTEHLRRIQVEKWINEIGDSLFRLVA